MGDAERAQAELTAFNVTTEFFIAKSAQLGLSGSLQEQNEDALELLQESFEADPAWSKKGSFLAKEPHSCNIGRLIIETDKAAPNAVENFTKLCTGEKGVGKASGKALHYKGCAFHRIVQGFCCQGGDITRGDGSGVVSMANSGKNSNSSQFFITLAAAPQCDGKHVVLGRVTGGSEVLQKINLEAASSDGRPRTRVWMLDCGVLN
ncbi:hypothetical protein WJX73_000441 [Symbiochloris irregularis]|uniref:Peptidyl-prolyl cis-trans isomerase n=1 Tax=Symbiochloris irregularis TaxID=706552 RepID=A0AAW1NNA3_9CHLO